MKQEKRTYGYNLSEKKEDITRCIQSVSEQGRYGSFHSHQCFRKRGFGKDGLYCKQHSKFKFNS